MSDNQKPLKSPRKLAAIAVATAVALGGAWSVQSFAGSTTAQHMKLIASDSTGWFGGRYHQAGWRGKRDDEFFDMSDAEIDAKITRAMKHVAIEIDATQEQQDKIIDLVTAAVKQLKPLRSSMLDARDEARDLLIASTIDDVALERLRAERLAQVDRISKTLVDAMAQAAAVLTPEQRRILDERIAEHRAKH
ncbi:MAG: Spy/CpxP family protein refolding chaperone [Aestuariivirgaceae bacterium]